MRELHETLNFERMGKLISMLRDLDTTATTTLSKELSDIYHLTNDKVTVHVRAKDNKLSYKILQDDKKIIEFGYNKDIILCLYFVMQQGFKTRALAANIPVTTSDMEYMVDEYERINGRKLGSEGSFDKLNNVYLSRIDGDGDIRCNTCAGYHDEMFIDISFTTSFFSIGMFCPEDEVNDFSYVIDSNPSERFDFISKLIFKDIRIYGRNCLDDSATLLEVPAEKGVLQKPSGISVGEKPKKMKREKSHAEIVEDLKKRLEEDIQSCSTGIKEMAVEKPIAENNTINNNKLEEEKIDMFNLKGMFKGMEFGAIKGDMFKLSMHGVAFKNEEGYVAYDKQKGEIIDVDAMNFDANGMIMQMPVAINAIQTGDIIMHQGKPMIVNKVRENGQIETIEPGASEVKTILPIKNMFGFNFITKIMPLIDFSAMGASASNDNPFGNMMPFMFMSEMMDGDGENNMMEMMLMSNMMSGGNMDMKSMAPFMFLGKNKNNSEKSSMSSFMEMYMMMNVFGQGENNPFASMFGTQPKNKVDEESKDNE